MLRGRIQAYKGAKLALATLGIRQVQQGGRALSVDQILDLFASLAAHMREFYKPLPPVPQHGPQSISISQLKDARDQTLRLAKKFAAFEQCSLYPGLQSLFPGAYVSALPPVKASSLRDQADFFQNELRARSRRRFHSLEDLILVTTVARIEHGLGLLDIGERRWQRRAELATMLSAAYAAVGVQRAFTAGSLKQFLKKNGELIELARRNSLR